MRRYALSVIGLVLPAVLAAQLPEPSTRALGMGGAYTALARGYEAVAWNPALLASSGNKSFSIGLPHLTFEVGSNTYGWSDFRDYANNTLSDADKQALLDEIEADDSVLTLRALGGFAPFGFSVGRFAFAAGTSGDLSLSVGPDALELFLYGNAARSGPLDPPFTAAGLGGRGWAATTFAGSVGWPFRFRGRRLAIGATYKMIIGHALAQAEELSSRFRINPAFDVSAEGHAVYTSYPRSYDPSGPGDILSGDGKVGSGYGVDVGFTLQSPGSRWMLSAVVVHALGSMDWDEDRLVYERTTLSLQETGTGGVTDAQSTTILRGAQIDADQTARALRDSLLDHANFSRVVRAGIGYRRGLLSFGAQGQLRLTEGLDRQSKQAVAAGAEYRLLHVLPIRVGAGWDFGETFTLTGGTGIQLFGFNLDFALQAITGSKRPGAVFSLGAGLLW